MQSEILGVFSSAKWPITFSLADKKPDLHDIPFPRGRGHLARSGVIEAQRFHPSSSCLDPQLDALQASSLVSPARPGEALAIMPDMGSHNGCRCGKAVQLPAAVPHPCPRSLPPINSEIEARLPVIVPLYPSPPTRLLSLRSCSFTRPSQISSP